MIQSLQEQAETQLRDERSRLAELGSLLPVDTQRRFAPLAQAPRDGNEARQQALDRAAAQEHQRQQQQQQFAMQALQRQQQQQLAMQQQQMYTSPQQGLQPTGFA